MLKQSVERIASLLKPEDKVLDIGAWASPLHRANYVLDHAPYETHIRNSERHNPHHIMGMPEQFSKATWIQRDICSREPYPFKDKELDFVVCSHTLEDIRDPIWVCSEMARIAKAGYIECPSRLIETCRGVNRDCPVGYFHHRWMVEAKGSRLLFRQKNGILFSHWSYSFPRRVHWEMKREDRIMTFFWNGHFEALEISPHDKDEIKADLAGFVAKHHPYPEWRFKAEKTWNKIRRSRKVVTGLFRKR